jgi:quercetin dioxygenase-like cupin family protein
MKAKWFCAVVAILVGTGAYAGSVLATPQAGVTTTLVGPATFDQFDIHAHSIPARWRARLKTHGRSDVYVADNKFAPGATTGWHSHPGPSLILVTAGAVTNYMADDPTCTGHVYTAGQGFIDAGGNDVHMLRNNSTTDPAETVAVQLVPQGAPRRIEEPDPGNCHF